MRWPKEVDVGAKDETNESESEQRREGTLAIS